jgi:hypothetical protein
LPIFSASARSAASSGDGSKPSIVSIAGSSRHRTGLDWATPRGSTPTTSYVWRTFVVTMKFATAAYSVADPPGPPGLTNSTPFDSPRAGTLSTRSLSLSPSGLA